MRTTKTTTSMCRTSASTSRRVRVVAAELRRPHGVARVGGAQTLPLRAAGSGLIGWGVLAALVVAVVAGLFFLRAEVVAYFPPAKRAYDTAGLDTAPRATVPGEGLKVLGNPTVAFRDDDGVSGDRYRGRGPERHAVDAGGAADHASDPAG